MTTRYEAWVNGVALSSIAPEIIIDDIQEQQPKSDVESFAIAFWNGTRVMSETRPSLSVTIRFMVRAYNPARRQEIVNDIVKWAKSGKQLEVSSREGLFLDCVVSTLPYVKSALKWLEQITITFTAYNVPYWQEKEPVTAEVMGLSGSAIITPNGTEECNLAFTVRNMGADRLNTLTVSVNGREIAFNNLQIVPSQSFSVQYVDGLLMLPVSKRTPDSNDNLILHPSTENVITFTADQSAKITFSARGLYS